MKRDEFTHTYSEDILHLVRGREALLTHPLQPAYSDECNASFCRLMIIVMVGNIEATLERWEPYDKLGVLANYFSDKVTNGDRVTSLCSAFKQVGVDDEDVFNDFLALKYLRNAIVHASWTTAKGDLKQDQIDWITSRRFPVNARELSEKDWKRILYVHDRMTTYIWTLGVRSVSHNEDSPEPSHFPMWLHNRLTPSGILTTEDWPRLHWLNLQRIHDTIQKKFSETLPAEPFAQTEEPPIEWAWKWYLAVRAALMQSGAHEAMTKHIDDAIFSFSEIRRLNEPCSSLSREASHKALDTLGKLKNQMLYPRDHWFPTWQAEQSIESRLEIVELVFPQRESISGNEIERFHEVGWQAKQAFPNDMAAVLFGLLLPVLSPEPRQDLMETAWFVVEATELGMAWYDWLEHDGESCHDLRLVRRCLEFFGSGYQNE